jgi:hypothetical protein
MGSYTRVLAECQWRLMILETYPSTGAHENSAGRAPTQSGALKQTSWVCTFGTVLIQGSLIAMASSNPHEQ